MSTAKRAKVKGKSLASRLTGISTPIGGISWTPPVDERDKARRLITFLNDRGVLFEPFDLEVGPYVVESAIKIRERLTADLEDVAESSPLGESLVAMRSACRRFLRLTQKPPRASYRIGEIISHLGELRALFGLHLAKIACAYDLALGRHLETILPPEREEPNEDEKKKPKRKRKSS